MASRQENEQVVREFQTEFDSVKDFQFFFNYVSTSFDHTASFSAVTFKAEPYITSAEARLAVKLNQLFEAKDPEPQHLEHLKFIKHCQQHIWPPNPNQVKYEKDVMIEICTEILKPLCGADELILESKYGSVFSKMKRDVTGLKSADIGLGTVKTWHGTPDTRVRGSHLVYRRVENEESGESDAESTASDGATSTIEAKRRFSSSNLPQMIATCIVSSFTEKGLHPDLPAVVPTILIDPHQFQVCLYDCQTDVLLISEPMELATSGCLSCEGMLILWLVINHR